MKNLLLLLLTVFLLNLTTNAQAPQLLNYQGVARNGFGNALPNRKMTLRLSILNGSNNGSVVYSETRTVTTNAGGLYTVLIGSGGTITSSGTIASINWQTDAKFLRVEVDPDAGSNFIDLGTTQLVSVPYAMSANIATPVGNAGGDLTGNYPNPVIANGAITTTKLADLAVTTLKLSDQSITTTKLADGSVTSSKLGEGSVTTSKMADANVTTAKIADASITDPKIVTVSGAKVTGNIAGNANNVNGTVAIVNGGTGATNATTARTNLGLGNVDNTSDLDKPISTATQTALDLKENLSNKSNATTLGTSDDLYPTQKAVKTYVDGQIASNATPDATSSIKGKIQLAGDLTGNAGAPEVASAAITTNKIADAAVITAKINDASVTTAKMADGSVATVKIADGSVTTIKLADAAVTDSKIVTISGSKVSGDIAGNAANVTGTVAIANGGTGATTATGARSNLGLGNVDNTSDLNKPISTATQAALELKENLSNKSTATTLGTSDDLYPTQKAVKTYVDGLVSAGTTPDATSSVKGKIQLAGDLTGNAGSPEVAANAITTAKIADAAIRTAKINDASITTAKLADGSVATVKIADASVTDAKIVTVAGSKVTGDIAGNASNVIGTVAIANGGTGATTVAAAKTNLGLNNVDNTSDLNKPISTATQTALDLKAPINNPTFTGTVNGISKSMVGLGNIDNTSDLNKPISNSTQSALDLKENLSNKSTATTLGTSDDFYPTQKAVKTYVDGQVSAGATPDATANVKGKIKLAGDLTGDAGAPEVAAAAITTTKIADAAVTTAKINDASITTAKLTDGNVTTAKLADASVTDVKIVGVSGSKVSGNITGNATNVTGTVAVANGGTGATTAAAARSNLGLGNVDNTSDLNKPISSATQSALDLKAPINNPTFTGTVVGITKTMVGLSNTDNTSDLNKPISNATQAALDLKASTNNPTFTGTVSGITKSMIGLGNVDNTSDIDKPISTAAQTALDLKAPINNPSFTGTFIASGITYPTSSGTNGQVLTTNGNGTTSWNTPTTAVTTVGAIGATSDAKGATISGSTLTLTPADATNGGVVTNGMQTFAGDKTYSKDLTVNGVTVGMGKNSVYNNTAVGNAALSSASNSGNDNTAIGQQALNVNTTGNNNTAIGSIALIRNTTGSFNTAVGRGAAYFSTTANYNSALGYSALFFNTTGSNNSTLGYWALSYNSTGSGNTGIGYESLKTNTTGNSNTAIGYKSDVNTSNLENATAIGNGAIVGSSNTIQLGNTNVTNVKTSGTITAGVVTYPNTDGVANQVLTTNGSGILNWSTVATAGVNNNITELTGLTTQKLITQIAGPINVASYSAGDVIYDQSSGDYYFFKKALSQTSSSFSNASAGYAIFDFGRMVIRFTPTENKEIKSITLRINGSITNGVLSIYSGLSACAPRDCPTVGGSIATVNPATILGSSVMTSGANSEITFNFTSPINVTANTNYYLTFSSDCTVGTGIMGSSGTDSNFSFSYGTCTIDQGIPAMKINYFNYSKL